MPKLNKFLPISAAFAFAIAWIGSIAGADEKEKAKPDPRISVLLFVITDCPIANRYAPEINRIYEKYSVQGVKFTLVYTDSSLTEKEIAAHRKDYSLKPEGVLDAKHVLVKKAGAKITPEAVVFDKNGKIVYRGRIDDQFTDFGDRRSEPKERNLRLALDAVLAGKEVAVKETTAIGCLIEDL